MSTYGKRYTLISCLGLIVKGEDQDAINESDPDYSRLRNAETEKELTEIFSELWNKYTADIKRRSIITDIRAARRKELAEGKK